MCRLFHLWKRRHLYVFTRSCLSYVAIWPVGGPPNAVRVGKRVGSGGAIAIVLDARYLLSAALPEAYSRKVKKHYVEVSDINVLSYLYGTLRDPRAFQELKDASVKLCA